MNKHKLINILFIFITNYICVLTQDIGFPEQEQNPEFLNKNNRQPIYIPGRCPQNELLYPGDHADDWICDCAPGFLYYPLRNLCYPAYKQGPCEKKQYLVLQSDSSIPKCISNPCQRNGYVFYQNMCHQLGKLDGPCGLISTGNGILGVNSTTFDVECLPSSVSPQLSSYNDPIYNDFCPSNSRRNYNGKCNRSVIVK
ncbi:uncharacterized protein LOC123294485 [Chrysoperla carnea]|uniref:uncharacterized protein LOC123294485 n=1 Tax=Chrysoperla carnea TaxID=189513 RepID=UPI001D083088|nr:uncharacterized protein LOC123294485 [Chrysoperla carnea]